MKNKLHVHAWITSFALALTFLLNPDAASANAELDRKYALETVGFLRAWDNVDGLFADYVGTAYREYFSQQSRFVLQDLSKADALIGKSKINYARIIQDDAILGQVVRSMKVDSLLRTQISKEGGRYRFTLDWLHAPGLENIATETFVLEEPRDGKKFGIGDVRVELRGALDRLVKKVPFQGHVSGRDNGSVTLNVGASSGLRKGDTLVIATLDEVKKHPLLKTVVDWRLTPIGKVEIEQVDEGIAFATVIEEAEGRQITRFQKITQVIPRKTTKLDVQVQDEKIEIAEEYAQPARLGWISGGLWLGSLQRDYSVSGGSSFQGAGIFLGAKAEGQLWLTRDWFFDLGMGFGLAPSFNQTDSQGLVAPDGSVTGTVFQFHPSVGYTFFSSPDFYGPKGWVKLGYMTSSYSFPVVTTQLMTPISVGGFTLGIGGDLPLREQYGALLSLDFGFLTGATESSALSGDSSGPTSISFLIGGYYRLGPRLVARGGIDFSAQSVNFTGTSLSTTSLRTITFTPQLQFFF